MWERLRCGEGGQSLISLQTLGAHQIWGQSMGRYWIDLLTLVGGSAHGRRVVLSTRGQTVSLVSGVSIRT